MAAPTVSRGKTSASALHVQVHSIRIWLYIARMLDHLGCHTYLDQPEDLEGHGAAAVLMRLHHADLCTAEHASSAKHPPSHCA